MLLTDNGYPRVYVKPTTTPAELPPERYWACADSYLVKHPGAHPVALDGNGVEWPRQYMSNICLTEPELLARGLVLCHNYEEWRSAHNR